MNPMKIAYIFTSIDFGGSEKVSLTFLKKVDRNKFHISPVLLVRPWEQENFFIQELKKEDYQLYKIPVAIKPRSKGRDYFRLLRCYRMIYSFLRKGSFDLVHTHGYFADIIGIPAAKILGIPVISTCHGFVSIDRNLKLYNLFDRVALRFAKKIIAVSDSIKNDLGKRGIRKTRIVTIQNAVNGSSCTESSSQRRLERRHNLGLSDHDFVVGYVGRLSEEKGVQYLIKAASHLNESDVPVKILIIGEGPQRKELEDLAKKANIGNNVIFAGFQSEIEKWLSAMDIFVLPSLTEGTPMSLLEAMAYGMPVVASAVGGVPQVIDSEKNGILVPPGKPQDIKDAIRLLYLNENLRKSFSREARQKIKSKYNIEDWTKKIEDEYLNMRIQNAAS